MKHYAPLFALLVFIASANAEKLLQLNIGPAWTSDLLQTDRPTAWNAGLVSGMIFDKKIGIGLEIDLLWNTYAKEEKDSSTGAYRTTKQSKSFMFPIGGVLVADPFGDWIVHPAARFFVGYNSLIYGHKDSISTPDTTRYYNGLILKGGIDACYNIGDLSAIFLGAEYQWADTRTLAKSNEPFFRRNMSGVSIRAGFRVTF